MKINTKVAVSSAFSFAIGFSFAFGFTGLTNNSMQAELFDSTNQNTEEVLIVTDTEDENNLSPEEKPIIKRIQGKNIKDVVRAVWKKCKESDEENTEECMQKQFDNIKKQSSANRFYGAPSAESHSGDMKKEEDMKNKDQVKQQKIEIQYEKMREKSDKRRKVLMDCRENSETSDEFKKCLKEGLQETASQEPNNSENFSESNQAQQAPAPYGIRKGAPQDPKAHLKEMIKTCLQEDPANLRECIKNALQEEGKNMGAPSGGYDQEKGGSILLPGQLPPVESDDISNPTI